MSRKAAEQLARIAAPRLFHKGDRGAIAPLAAVFKQLVDGADLETRDWLRQKLKVKPPPADVVDWAVLQVGRWGLLQWLSKLPRSDPVAAALLAANEKVEKVLAAATRFGLARTDKGDDRILASWYRKVAIRRKAMANNYTFDARGLPDGFDQAKWSGSVDAQLAKIGLPAGAANEIAYAGIKGALLLSEQFDPDAGTFRDALRTAWDEVLIRQETVPTHGTKPGSNITAYARVA
jgi:hypothetical protein